MAIEAEAVSLEMIEQFRSRSRPVEADQGLVISSRRGWPRSAPGPIRLRALRSPRPKAGPGIRFRKKKKEKAAGRGRRRSDELSSNETGRRAARPPAAHNPYLRAHGLRWLQQSRCPETHSRCGGGAGARRPRSSLPRFLAVEAESCRQPCRGPADPRSRSVVLPDARAEQPPSTPAVGIFARPHGSHEQSAPPAARSIQSPHAPPMLRRGPMRRSTQQQPEQSEEGEDHEARPPIRCALANWRPLLTSWLDAPSRALRSLPVMAACRSSHHAETRRIVCEKRAGWRRRESRRRASGPAARLTNASNGGRPNRQRGRSQAGRRPTPRRAGA